MNRALSHPWLVGPVDRSSDMSPLIWPLLPLLYLQMREHCYLMKQVLNFTLEEVLLPQLDRFQPYMQEVVPFLAKLSSKLSPCVSPSLSCIHPTPSCLPSLLLPCRALFPTVSCPSSMLPVRRASTTLSSGINPRVIVLTLRHIFEFTVARGV